ncbi:unnamed protein product [Rotaria sp. Silwood1]|nr:unnamed protein product [Rotaria sp. Silwood1]CAF5094977.1 unnamed protein product [Rotaria sp. Silwood1]
MKNQIDIDCEDDDKNEGILEFIYEIDSDKSYYSNNDETQSIVMNMSIYMEYSYCCRSTSCSLNNYNNATKNITSSPLHSSYASSPFDNSLLPIVPTTNVKNLNKTRTSTWSTKRKPVKSDVNINASPQSTPSQIIPRKKIRDIPVF